mgnify:CR=1 FL=1
MLIYTVFRYRNQHFPLATSSLTMPTDYDLSKQASLFDVLSDEKRLRILRHAVNGPVAAPELAESDEFDVSSESLLYHMNLLEGAGFLTSSTVQGPYKRPRKEFRLSGNGRQLTLEIIADEYHFEFREPPIA